MKSIIIAEDDSSERLVLRGLVEELGHQVVSEAATGKEALEACGKFKPDVVLMDINMPEMGGLEAAEEIGKGALSPVVLLTASEDERTIRKAADTGSVMAYLVKPVRLEDLSPAIELAVSRFREFETLKRENRDLKDALSARKAIEKAKGLLIQKEGLTEDEAFSRIRKISMDKRKSMADIAEVIILAFEGKKA